MRCIDRCLWLWLGVAGVGPALLGGCSRPSAPLATAASAAPGMAPTGVPAGIAPMPEPPAAPSPAPVKAALPLPPPGPLRTAAELRRQAAHRIVAANPHGTYTGPVHEPLLAIPVLEVELHRDGSIARIVILRAPRQAKDTSQLAIAAVRRAAPFGDVSQLPRPWRFTETFLFDDDRKFKPRTLDE